MSIQSEHPDYVKRHPDWVIMRDAAEGERRIKCKTFTYLPATSGMVIDGAKAGTEPGKSAYQAYLERAVYPNAVDDAVKILVGALHRKPSKIKVPAALEPMLQLATREKDTMEGLLRKINEQQLLTGRVGLLVDVTPKRDVPHLVPYVAESIINWDDQNPDPFDLDQLQMVVLRECITERTDMFGWELVTRYRACVLEREFVNGEPQGEPKYMTWTEQNGEPAQDVEPFTPLFKGREMTEIPFVFIGSNDLTPLPDEIPLLGLARYALVVYRGEADLRATLFMLGQDTLVTIGEDSGGDDADAGPGKQTRIGVGAKIEIPMGGDAKFIGVHSDGLPEQRRVLSDDHTKLREMGSRLLEPRSGQAESGEALKVRVAAQTSTLLQLAVTAAEGLTKALRLAAEWVGANPDEVEVIPNLDFAETKARSADLRDLMDARERGAPLSYESIHMWAKQNGFTDMEFEAEVAAIKKEKELQALLVPVPPPAPAGGPPKPGAPPAPGTKPGAPPADQTPAAK